MHRKQGRSSPHVLSLPSCTSPSIYSLHTRNLIVNNNEIVQEDCRKGSCRQSIPILYWYHAFGRSENSVTSRSLYKTHHLQVLLLSTDSWRICSRQSCSKLRRSSIYCKENRLWTVQTISDVYSQYQLENASIHQDCPIARDLTMLLSGVSTSF